MPQPWNRSTIVKCDLCPYEKPTRKVNDDEYVLPREWSVIHGAVLCPQCVEMMERNTKNMKRRAFGYARASTTKQEMSLEIQKEKITEYCKMRDLDLVDIYVDEESASKVMFTSRKAGRNLYAALTRGDHVVMAKYDRGFRNVADCLTMYERWVSQGVFLHFACEGGLVPPTPTGKFMITLMIAAAEYEASLIGQRQRDYQMKRKKKGNPHQKHTPVTGFITVNMGSKPSKHGFVPDRKLLLCEEETPHRELFHRKHYNEGYGIRMLERYCKEQSIYIPEIIREQSGNRIGQYYSRERIRRLIILEGELREIKAMDSSRKEWTTKELTQAWLEHFYASGRTKVLQGGRVRKREFEQAAKRIIEQGWS